MPVLYLIIAQKFHLLPGDGTEILHLLVVIGTRVSVLVSLPQELVHMLYHLPHLHQITGHRESFTGREEADHW